jgi:hypothetical protein
MVIVLVATKVFFQIQLPRDARPASNCSKAFAHDKANVNRYKQVTLKDTGSG